MRCTWEHLAKESRRTGCPGAGAAAANSHTLPSMGGRLHMKRVGGLVFAGCDWKRKKLTGILVTYPEPSLYPAAWVPGVSRRSLELAGRIAKDYSLAASTLWQDSVGILDLRKHGVRWDRQPFPKWFDDLWLLGVNASGTTRPDDWMWAKRFGHYCELHSGKHISLLFTGLHFPTGHVDWDRPFDAIPRTNMPPVPKPGRRRPGENWDLWQVRLGGQAPYGYLVTSGRQNAPELVAFVMSKSRRELKLALEAREGRFASAQVMNLRGEFMTEANPEPPALLLMEDTLIFPIDRHGRIIGSDAESAAGQYVRPEPGRTSPSFRVFSRNALEHWRKEQQRPFAAKPRTATPNAPKPVSIKSSRAITAAAA